MSEQPKALPPIPKAPQSKWFLSRKNYVEQITEIFKLINSVSGLTSCVNHSFSFNYSLSDSELDAMETQWNTYVTAKREQDKQNLENKAAAIPLGRGSRNYGYADRGFRHNTSFNRNQWQNIYAQVYVDSDITDLEVNTLLEKLILENSELITLESLRSRLLLSNKGPNFDWYNALGLNHINPNAGLDPYYAITGRNNTALNQRFVNIVTIPNWLLDRGNSRGRGDVRYTPPKPIYVKMTPEETLSLVKELELKTNLSHDKSSEGRVMWYNLLADPKTSRSFSGKSLCVSLDSNFNVTFDMEVQHEDYLEELEISVTYKGSTRNYMNENEFYCWIYSTFSDKEWTIGIDPVPEISLNK